MKVYVPSVEKIKSFEWDYKNTYLSDVFDNQYGERIQQGFLIAIFRSTIGSFYPNSAAYSSEIKPNEDKLFLGPCISSISQRH